MDFFSNFLGSIFGGGGSISGSAGGGADAYKGDGPMGIGEFLKGVAQAYKIENEKTNETVLRLRDADKIKLDTALDHALNHFVQSQYEKSNAITDARAASDNSFHKVIEDLSESQIQQELEKICRKYFNNVNIHRSRDDLSKDVIWTAREVSIILYKILNTK